MTPQEFRAARKRLGMTQEAFARLLGYQGKHRADHIRAMETEPSQKRHRPVPPWIAAHVRSLNRV